MAEREGFEPPIPVKVCPLSRRIVSTTHAPLRKAVFGYWSLVVGLSVGPCAKFADCRELFLANELRPTSNGDSHSLPPASKKNLQHFRATPCQNAGTNFHPVIQAGMVQHLHYRADGSSFGVIGAVNQAFKPGVDQRACAHRARFNCSKQLAAFQAMVAESGTSFTQRDDLGVGSGIA